MIRRPPGGRIEAACLVLLFSAGFLETEWLSLGPITLSTTEILIALLVVVVGANRLRARIADGDWGRTRLGGPTAAAMLFLAASTLASAIACDHYRLLSVKYALRFGGMVVLYVALANALADSGRRRLTYRTIAVAMSLFAAVAVVEHFYFPAVESIVAPFRSNIFVGTPPPAYFSSGVILEGGRFIIRSSSVFLHANVLGYILAMASMLVVAGLQPPRPRWLPVAVAAVLLVCWYALTLTYSRGAFLAVAVPGVAVMTAALVNLPRVRELLFVRHRGATAAIVACLLVAAVVNPLFVKGVEEILPASITHAVTQRLTGNPDLPAPAADEARESALTSRLTLWKAALAMAREHPVLGIGPDNFRMRFFAYVDRMDEDLSINKGIHRAHNLFLNILAEQGIVGALAYLLLLAAVLRSAWRGWKRNGVCAETLGLAGALGAFLIGNLFDTIFYFYTYMILVLAIFASWEALSAGREG